MGYLDSAGLAHLWEIIQGKLPGPMGPAGPDGNPIGTIISFMGASAPKDYLVCDGAEYGIGDYPALAAFFARQFGAANYFGGDGTDTFAVPDISNATSETMRQYYTSRPVNMAVLYCIKAVESVASGNAYSEEEQLIGTWFGKPLYRKTRIIDVGELPVINQEGTLTLLTNELSGKIPVRMQSIYHVFSSAYNYDAYFDAGVNSNWNNFNFRFTASFENGDLILQYRWSTAANLEIFHSYEYVKNEGS